MINSWSLVSIGIVILVLFVLFITYRRKKIDYYSLFQIGIIWTVVGLLLNNRVLWIPGLLFMIIGLINRKKWRKIDKWSSLSKNQKKFKLIFMISLIIALILALVIYFILRG